MRGLITFNDLINRTAINSRLQRRSNRKQVVVSAFLKTGTMGTVVSQAKIGDRVQIPGALAPLGVPPSAAEIRSITPEKIFEIVVYAVLPI